MSFANKVVIVTGASSGIGAATAIEFSKQGARVVLVARNEAKLREVAEQCENSEKHLVVKADLSNDYDVRAMVVRTIETFGRIDVVVNNAGLAKMGSVFDGNLLEAYDATLQTNLRSVVLITSLVVPYLIETKGNIVNVSSVAANTAPFTPQLVPYSVSKAALNSFSVGVAVELASRGVRINLVSPGPVETDFASKNDAVSDDVAGIVDSIPLKRSSKPIEIADLILFLASEKAKGVTGSVYVVDNGYMASR